jgi:hypothetical protein
MNLALDNYVWEENPLDVYSVLYYSKFCRDKIMMWQMDDKGERKQVQARIEAIDTKNGFFYIVAGKLLSDVFKSSQPVF